MGMLISLAIALMFTPWLSKRMLSHAHAVTQAGDDPRDTRLQRFFERIMAPFLRGDGARSHRHKLYLGVVVAIALAVSLAVVQWVVMKMLPFDNKSEFQVVVDMPEGTALEETGRVLDELAAKIAERPEVMVIASSDSDFAPLVARLREKGCRVIGIGQQGKTGDETQTVYDDYEVLTHHKPRAAREERPRAVREEKPAAKAPPKPVAKAPVKRAPRRKAVPAVAAPALPDKAQAILRALPALARGETVELRVAAQALRDAGLLSRSGSSTKLFGQFTDLFELQPPKAPNHVKALPATRA
jgi:multidrug efflux pump subunit AcrB